MNDAAQMQEILDRLRNRFFDKYRGTVIDVDDTTMCVRAQIPAVLGVIASGWCQPCVPYAGPNVGVFMLPDIGSGIRVEFEGGDVSRPIWVGCFWRAGEIPSTADAGIKQIVTGARSVAFDTSAPSITIAGTQSQTAVLDGQGITLSAGSGKVVVGTSGVDVNRGALTVS